MPDEKYIEYFVLVVRMIAEWIVGKIVVLGVRKFSASFDCTFKSTRSMNFSYVRIPEISNRYARTW